MGQMAHLYDTERESSCSQRVSPAAFRQATGHHPLGRAHVSIDLQELKLRQLEAVKAILYTVGSVSENHVFIIKELGIWQ